MLFQNIQEVKTHVGGGVNASMELTVFRAAYRQARRQHLERYLSAAFLDELEAAAAATPSETQLKAIAWVGEPLALLMVYEYTFTSSVQMGGEGLTRPVGENVEGAYKYQVKDYRDWSISAGLTALDQCLVQLEANAADYATWATGPGAAYHRSLLIRTTDEMRMVHSKVIDRRAYEALRPLLADVQLFVAESILGPVQMAELLDAITSDTYTEYQRELITRLRRSLAGYVVSEAVTRNLLQLKGNRLVQTEALEPQSVQREGTPGMNAINLVAMQTRDFAARHLTHVKEYLAENADQFPAYQAYQASRVPDPDEDYPNAIPNRRRGGKVTRL
ncbi:MAG: DUF6712 family protein [Bacteroidota bacterium]